MKRYKIWNSIYDLWWHALHDDNEKIKNFIEKYWNVKHYRQKRNAIIDYKNEIKIPFPFQLHLKYLNSNKKNII